MCGLIWDQQLGVLMSIDNHMVTLQRIPEIKAVIESGNDYMAIMSFVATIAVVLVSAAYNGYVLRKTLASQEFISERSVKVMREQSQSEAVARSRQDWINNLKESIASFLSAGHAVSTAHRDLLSYKPIDPATKADVVRFAEVIDELGTRFSNSLTTAKLYYSKVELSLNPSEQDSKDLMVAMDKYINAASTSKPTADLGSSVVAIAQTIIKSEWSRVKLMT